MCYQSYSFFQIGSLSKIAEISSRAFRNYCRDKKEKSIFTLRQPFILSRTKNMKTIKKWKILKTDVALDNKWSIVHKDTVEPPLG